MSWTIRPTDVLNTRAKYRAVAECTHREDGKRCTWTHTQIPYETDAYVRRQARQHVSVSGGHEVVVVVRDVTRYYLPAALRELLAESDAPADGVTRPGVTEESREN